MVFRRIFKTELCFESHADSLTDLEYLKLPLGGDTQALLRTVLFSAHNSSAVIFAFVIDAACVSRDFFPSEMNENGD